MTECGYEQMWRLIVWPEFDMISMTLEMRNTVSNLYKHLREWTSNSRKTQKSETN